MSHYDSESEDDPRVVLDVDADYRLMDYPNSTFKLRNFKLMVDDGNGNMISFSGHLDVRPVPSPAVVQRARGAMGNGANSVWAATLFTPETGASPASLFASRRINTTRPAHHLERFALRRRHVPQLGGLKTMLLFTDGSCLNNGALGAKAGWAFVFKSGQSGIVKGALERKGPDGIEYVATSNRAELRVVIAALEVRAWWCEGWERIVIATDPEYVANGAMAWLRSWANHGWRTTGQAAVRNRDLWEKLSDRMRESLRAAVR